MKANDATFLKMLYNRYARSVCNDGVMQTDLKRRLERECNALGVDVDDYINAQSRKQREEQTLMKMVVDA